MDFWIFFGLIILTLLSIPLFCFLIKRLILLSRIKRCCKKLDLKFYKNHSLWFLGNRNNPKSDFVIETDTEIISVKLFGIHRKSTKLFIKENGDYFLRKYYAFMSSKSQALLFTDSKPKPFNKFVFEISSRSPNKPTRNIMLINPVALEIIFQPKHGTQLIMDSGDELFGMMLYDLNGFLKRINKKNDE